MRVRGSPGLADEPALIVLRGCGRPLKQRVADKAHGASAEGGWAWLSVSAL